MFAASGARLQLRASRNDLATEEAERDVFVQERRACGRGDEADLFAVLQQLDAARGKCGEIVGKADAGELPVHVADGADAVEAFLPDIAALGVAHRTSVEARASLRRKRGFVQVGAKSWNAGFDARDLKGVPAAGASAELTRCGDEFVRDGGEGVRRHEEIEARGAKAREVHHIYLAKRRIGESCGCVRRQGQLDR